MLLLSLPLLIAVAGGIVGFIVSSFCLRSMQRKKAPVVVVLVALALVTTAIPYMGEQFYDIGIPTGASFLLEGIGYFAFAFATVGAWVFLAPSRTRLLLLIPINITRASAHLGRHGNQLGHLWLSPMKTLLPNPTVERTCAKSPAGRLF